MFYKQIYTFSSMPFTIVFWRAQNAANVPLYTAFGRLRHVSLLFPAKFVCLHYCTLVSVYANLVDVCYICLVVRCSPYAVSFPSYAQFTSSANIFLVVPRDNFTPLATSASRYAAPFVYASGNASMAIDFGLIPNAYIAVITFRGSLPVLSN